MTIVKYIISFWHIRLGAPNNLLLGYHIFFFASVDILSTCRFCKWQKTDDHWETLSKISAGCPSCLIFSRNIANINYNNRRTLENAMYRLCLAECLEDLLKECGKNNKMRTNRLFKSTFEPEKYLQMNMSTRNHSAFARLICRISPICKETDWQLWGPPRE